MLVKLPQGITSAPISHIPSFLPPNFFFIFPKCHPLYDKINYWTKNPSAIILLYLKNRYHFPSLSSAVPMSCAVGFSPSDCTLTGNCSPLGWISMATDFNRHLQQLSCVLQYPSAENMSTMTVISITSPLG